MHVQDVEAATPVHEHLGEPGVDDDGIHDEWVLARIRDVVGVIFAAEGDGVLRPVEVGCYSLVDGEDLSALSLALPSDHIRRWPTEDEEHVLHRGETITAFVLLVLLLGLVLAADMVEVLSEHVTFLEGVINLALMIRARLLEHVVE